MTHIIEEYWRLAKGLHTYYSLVFHSQFILKGSTNQYCPLFINGMLAIHAGVDRKRINGPQVQAVINHP